MFPYLLGFSGLIYFIGAFMFGTKFVVDAYLLMVLKSDKRALDLFKYSITYLAILFALLIIDHYWKLNI